ncbi:MAG: Crp/Fnr family transcriptional regulator [Acidobacteriota bacterium]|nr:Crp/Fnr family transcriptional regulator [Acidobacteriota bacterium]
MNLNDSAIVGQLGAEARRRLSAAAEERNFRRGEALFHQGEPLKGLFILLAGRVKLSQVGPDGHETIMRLVAPGDAFAAVAAFSHARSYPVSALAMTDVTLAFWPRRTAQRLVSELPELAGLLTEEISRHAQVFQQRLREVSTERVSQRLARTLLRLAGQASRPHDAGTLIDFPLTRQDLAGLAGTTLFTVSRLLSAWSDRGILQVGRARVIIRSAPDLLMEAGGDDSPAS